MKKYKADKNNIEISEIEITKETPSSIYYTRNGKDYLERKESNHLKICDSYSEAREFLINNVMDEIRKLTLRIDKLKEKAEKAKSL